MGNNLRSKVWVFHKDADAIDNGNAMYIAMNDVLMNIAVTGSAVDLNLIIEAKAHDNDDYSSVSCINLETFDMSPNITDNGKYQIGLEGLTQIRICLSAITSGACSVYGTVVN